LLGELLLQQDFAQEALPHLELAGNLYLQGVALLVLKRLPETVKSLVAADARHPDDPKVLFYLGGASSLLMERAFTRIVTAHPDSPRALQLQARNYLAQGRGDLAEPMLRNALKIKRDLPGVHLDLGRILQEQRGDLNGAEQEFRAEAQLWPGSAEASWRRGAVLLKKRLNKGGPGRTPTLGPAATQHVGHVIGFGQGLHDGESDRSRRERLPAHYRDQRCGRGSRHGAFAVVSDLPEAGPGG